MHSRGQFIDADGICAATFIRHVEVHDTLDSTNTRAAELAREANIELPALVIARHQTAGRGRGHNKWWSADGALTFSVLLEPAGLGIGTANWPQLSLATAVAVCDALESAVERVRLAIKWPNDVMLDGRKVAGILIESPGGAAPAKDRLVIGIGINVNNSLRITTHNAPSDGAALCDITGQRHDVQSLLVNHLRALDRRLVQLAANDAQLAKSWQQLAWLTAQNVVVENDVRAVSGRFAGFANDGALLIETDTTTERIYSGSVRSS